MIEQLNEEQKQEAKELFIRLSELYKQKVELEDTKKSRLNTLVYEIASASGEEEKDIKKPILLTMLAVINSDKPNKYELDFNIASEYMTLLKNGSVSNELVRAMGAIEEELADNKMDLKEVFKEATLLPKEYLDAIALMAKQKYNEFKEDRRIENGENVKPKKDKSELDEYVAQIKNIINE